MIEHDLDEEAFTLLYYVNGLTLTEVESMSTSQRWWWLRRLNRQHKLEAKAMKKGM